MNHTTWRSHSCSLNKNDYGHIRLSFSKVSDEDIIKGIKVIGQVLDEMNE